MRFLLVNPYYPISETPSPPLGLACLAAALESVGIEVYLLDFVVFPYSQSSLEKTIAAFDPHCVGVTAVTMNVDDALLVLRDVKNISRDIFTVMGGPHVTFCAQETMDACPDIDAVVLGEGEATVVELVKTLKSGKSLQNVRGLVYRENQTIKFTGPRPFIANIAALPEPARHHIPLGRYRALGMPVSITTSRGCPFHCIFCVGRKMVGATVRYRNPKDIADEIAKLSRLGFHQINIADDLFTASKQHCSAVCDEIIQRNIRIPWTSFARVDTVSPDLLKEMKIAGCTAISFGVESGSPDILKRIRKGITLDQVFAAVAMCNDAGITPQASFILGLPGETPETLNATVELGNRLKQMGVQHGFHLLAPFPGTEIRENISRYDLQILSHDWKNYHANRAIVRTAAVSPEMMDAVVKAWEHQFNLWLDNIKRGREKGELTAAEAWPLTHLEHTVLLYELMMKRAIETRGCLLCSDNPVTDHAAVEGLADRLDGIADQPRDQLLETLAYACDQGYITYTVRNGRCQWAWIDYLR
jgi:anaerobic magnesium-protoporphyrin IX monomethyl ester cyclase